MTWQLQSGFLICFALSWAACAAPVDDWRDQNRPASFGYTCDADASTCKAPFSCMQNGMFGMKQCTLACRSDDDCPHWQATGDCGGAFQSPCEQGVCQPHGFGCR
jgi:hypothetical protein